MRECLEMLVLPVICTTIAAVVNYNSESNWQ